MVPGHRGGPNLGLSADVTACPSISRVEPLDGLDLRSGGTGGVVEGGSEIGVPGSEDDDVVATRAGQVDQSEGAQDIDALDAPVRWTFW